MIFKNTRAKGSHLLHDTEFNKEDGGVKYLSPFRERIFDEELGDLKIVFSEGMRLDLLAEEYLGDASLDWVILDVNPKYLTPFDIKVGDVITIPLPQRVMNDE